MNGSLLRISLIAGTLLRQNRVLILLLLWPFVLSGILLAADHGAPATEDIAAVLEQELFYGLVLVGLGASVALGTEQRAHRTQQVLGRAVGRAEYLLALGVGAYLPFAGYVLVWLVNAAAFAGLLHLHTPTLLPPVVAEFAAGLLLCGVGLFCSVVLPQMPAAAATGAALAALLGAGAHAGGRAAQLFGLFAAILGERGGRAVPWAGAGEAIIVSAVAIVAAALVFARRDLKLV